MATTIRPADFPDFHVIGRQTGTQHDFVGREFLTHCLPDVPPRHRILALLGTTDIGNAASPSEDGWPKDMADHQHSLDVVRALAPNQIWLTCEDPETLVAKYHEYLHGDSNGDRRVVLDTMRLPDILGTGNLRVVPRDILLERYLNTLQEQATEAARLGEHLVLLIFGHGTTKYGVEVGGSILQIGDLRRVLLNSSQVTIFTTSCYSGGWLVLHGMNQQPLDATAIASAGPDDCSLSWPLSGSIGRASGSLAATAVLRCLVDAEDEIKERMEHPTYIQLAKSIYDCMKGMGTLGNSQQIHFSAENDEWESSYQVRLGLPLTSYKERWQSLRQVPPSPSQPGSQLAGASGRSLKRLQYLAKEYFASQPGADNAAPNVGLHSCLKQVLNRASYSKEKVQELTEITAYRLGAMHEAEYLWKETGAEYPSIFDIDPSQRLAKMSDKELIMKTWSMLLTYDINTTPIGIRRPHVKPLQYLTLALVETCQSWAVIEHHVKAMVGKKKAWYRFIFKEWQGNRVAHDEGVRRNPRAFLEAVKKIRQ
ncbi:uncharacterized protein N7515_009223 [Penicillium bovifimosum]|uniref:Uncharacterized protein n=1 Tax=Penicillium bovifimosum TaxID=126998 RepID=A0A9W9GIW4_9EURO|nr:uncharacterized protein N7515_009223 [Penicillium bovifimosum]KAJ5121262.1 hypothetical protein N7515_009223 [Penicillium bovifimosum]